MKGACRKSLLAFCTIVLVSLMSSPHAYAVYHVGGAMKGGDTTYGSQKAAKGGSCSGAVARCKKNFPANSAACESSGESCKQSGVFINPQGKSTTGLKKQ